MRVVRVLNPLRKHDESSCLASKLSWKKSNTTTPHHPSKKKKKQMVQFFSNLTEILGKIYSGPH